MPHDIGVIGLAVMGKNLAQNLAEHGYSIAVYNRSPEKTEALLREKGALPIEGYEDLSAFVAALTPPRKIILMVQAGPSTDAVIDALVPLLAAGDIIADGGNAHYKDTQRRATALSARGIRLIGLGISGGEHGARFGPSLMPGGEREAYAALAPMLEAIAARADDGKPCVTYLGPAGVGHYVKMVHNGIEYADMQLIAESFDLLKTALGQPSDALAGVYARFNEGPLKSYLIEITADILRRIDPATNRPLVDVILDVAEQKGTGRWMSEEALALGIPLGVITEAVMSRALSAHEVLRRQAEAEYRRVASHALPSAPTVPDPEAFIVDVEQALDAGKIIAYAQGFHLLETAKCVYGWPLPLSDIARIWRAGCIIRAALLDDIARAYDETPELEHLFLAPPFRKRLVERLPALRRVVSYAVQNGVPVPALSSALAYIDGLARGRLPANLIQAQRDYFGSHTYRRVDREGIFHTDWQTLPLR